MTYDFQTRLNTLGTRFKEISTESITYRRGSTKVTIDNINLGKVDVEQLLAFGITNITSKALDFIFDTSELSSLEPSTPLQGDEIVYGGNTYEVMPFGDQTYDFVTTSRQRIRVHTKQIG